MPESGERSIGAVLQSIVGNIEQIVRSEIRLAKAEVTHEVSKTAAASKLLGIGTALGAFAVGLLLLSAVYLLATVISPWIAAALVALTTGAAAAIFISVGKSRLKLIHPTPAKTFASIKENVEWAKSQAK